MKVKDVISESLLKMGEKDFIFKQNLSEREQDLRDSLLSCFNLAFREAATLYMPKIVDEDVTFSDGVLNVSDLSERILYPVRLTADGGKIPFKTYADRIEAKCKTATLRYAVAPCKTYKITDDVDDMLSSESVLSDGTLAKYYYANKVFDLARAYDNAFKNALGNLRYKGKRMQLKARGWTD